MSWFSSRKEDDESADGATTWPPKFQSFEEYKSELDQAIDTHPPFGVWLRRYRNVSHMTHSTAWLQRNDVAMWNLPVTKLKERYFHSASLDNCTKISKRTFIEMQLEENKETYDKEESELQAKKASYALALESYEQARRYGYRHIPRPKEPEKSLTLMQRDILVGELEKLVDPTD